MEAKLKRGLSIFITSLYKKQGNVYGTQAIFAFMALYFCYIFSDMELIDKNKFLIFHIGSKNAISCPFKDCSESFSLSLSIFSDFAFLLPEEYHE